MLAALSLRGLRGGWPVVACAMLVSTPGYAQAARTLATSVLLKEPQTNAAVVAEVPAGMELKLEWDKAVWVDLLKHAQQYMAPPFPFVFQENVKVWALLPSKESDGKLWLRVLAPNKKKAWIRQEDVALVPGSELTFSEPVPVLIPVRKEQILILREGRPADVHELMFQNWKSRAIVRLFLIVDPQGETKAVGLVQSSGIDLLDRMVAHSAGDFRFAPFFYEGKPISVILVLHFEYSGGS